MDDNKEDLKWISRAILVIGIVILLFVYPTVGQIIGYIIAIALLILLGLLIYSLLFCSSSSNSESLSNSEECRDDEGFPSSGSSIDLFHCEPNPYYTSKAKIEQKCKLRLPDFVVKECKESPREPDGWYLGKAEIEFSCIINEEVLNQIKFDSERLGIRLRTWSPGEYLIPIISPRGRKNVELWNLIIKENSNQGLIRYRHPYNQ